MGKKGNVACPCQTCNGKITSHRTYFRHTQADSTLRLSTLTRSTPPQLPSHDSSNNRHDQAFISPPPPTSPMEDLQPMSSRPTTSNSSVPDSLHNIITIPITDLFTDIQNIQEALDNLDNSDDVSIFISELVDPDTDDDTAFISENDISQNNTTQSSKPVGFDTRTNRINALMDNICSPLYLGSTISLLACILAIFRIRTTYKTKQIVIATIFTLLQWVLPKGHILPSFQDARIIIRRYGGLKVQKIPCCSKKGCDFLFRNRNVKYDPKLTQQHANLLYCPRCNTSRYTTLYDCHTSSYYDYWE